MHAALFHDDVFTRFVVESMQYIGWTLARPLLHVDEIILWKGLA